MAKPNYSFEKRQRDLAKKQKAEQKRQRKAEAHAAPAANEDEAPVEQNGPQTDDNTAG